MCGIGLHELITTDDAFENELHSIGVCVPVLLNRFRVEVWLLQPVSAAITTVVLVVREEEAYSDRNVQRDGPVLDRAQAPLHAPLRDGHPVRVDRTLPYLCGQLLLRARLELWLELQ